MAAKALKNPYRLQTVTFILPQKGLKEKPKITYTLALVIAFGNENGKICHRSILAEYLEDFFFRLGQSQYLRSFYIENYAYCSFCGHSTHCFILSLSADALDDFYSRIVDRFIFTRLLFLSMKGYCVSIINKIIHGCLQIQNFSSRVQLDI